MADPITTALARVVPDLDLSLFAQPGPSPPNEGVPAPPRGPMVGAGIGVGPAAAPAPPKPVLQTAALPITINPALYKNAFSSSNTNGDFRAAYAFRQLVDPVPLFQQHYFPSGSSFESVYGTIVRNANALPGITQSVLADAQRAFNAAALAPLTGTPDASWRLVEANPPTWWDMSVPGQFQDISLDLLDSGNGNFTILGGADALALRVGTTPALPPDPGTSVKAITLKAQAVVLKRSWFSPTLFSLAGWSVASMQAGACSSGETTSNPGLLPLAPTCFLVGRQVQVDAVWGPSDSAALSSAGSAPVSLGPFPLQAQGGALPPLFVIGVISALVPFSPPS
ncbi:MAG: hypothetical protein JOZ90_08605 [Alphaproteobacteria bacterium]|nr:hypothetical protein [Alphaproteobacteria bacterium]MBV9370926.1 hypothetical protein [Alphaproteobacteria bacterium]MBV9901144.1 hypothetical protein [Alphaproteobacteria bacterium]